MEFTSREGAPVTAMRERDLLRGLFEAAVAAADPMKVVPPHLPSPPPGRTLVLAGHQGRTPRRCRRPRPES